MARMLVALLAGALFGTGLAVSGMMNPAKVIGFLDFAGDWDSTLVFVMGGALLVCVPAFRLVLRWPRPVLADGFALPARNALDARLLGGAALFGIGWGPSGFCPGPAVAAVVPALAAGLPAVLGFFAAMTSGMALHAHPSDGRSATTRGQTGEANPALRSPTQSPLHTDRHRDARCGIMATLGASYCDPQLHRERAHGQFWLPDWSREGKAWRTNRYLCSRPARWAGCRRRR